jgi:hypothetical protein
MSVGDPSAENRRVARQWQLYGVHLAAYGTRSGNALPLFWHCLCLPPRQPLETGRFSDWHADCYVSIKKIWSTGKGFPK